jgi:hypothetical protein
MVYLHIKLHLPSSNGSLVITVEPKPKCGYGAAVRMLSYCIPHHPPENLKERDHLADVGIDGRVILQWALQKYGVRQWAGFIWLRI